MQEDTLLLTTEERDRPKVLHEVLQGHGTQRCAAQQLKLSTRQVRRPLRRKPGGCYHDWNENFDLHKAPPI